MSLAAPAVTLWSAVACHRFGFGGASMLPGGGSARGLPPVSATAYRCAVDSATHSEATFDIRSMRRAEPAQDSRSVVALRLDSRLRGIDEWGG